MKRIYLILAFLVMAALLAGCGVAGSGSSTQSNARTDTRTDTDTATSTARQEAEAKQLCMGVVVAGSCNVIEDAGASTAGDEGVTVSALPFALAEVCGGGWIAFVLLGLVALIASTAGNR